MPNVEPRRGRSPVPPTPILKTTTEQSRRLLAKSFVAAALVLFDRPSWGADNAQLAIDNLQPRGAVLIALYIRAAGRVPWRFPMKQQTFPSCLIAFSLSVTLLLAACGGSGQATPTSSYEQIRTQAVASFAADLTSTALAMPTATPTSTETPAPTDTSTSAVTNAPGPAATSAGVIPTSSCYGLTFVADVSIPDNSTMTPGKNFTKTWRVRNSGSCAWQEGSSLKFTGGEEMSGSSVVLKDAVQAGKEVELSVALTAPSSSGTYRGNWRMTTASGTYFGDEIYVLIVVSGSTATVTLKASATSTVASTATPSPTYTATESPTDTQVP